MPVIYRTDDATRWGVGKGANLTPTEVDLNFWDLAQRLVELETGGASPNGISNITVVGSQMTIYLDDGTALGPYTLPTAIIRFRGNWAAATVYYELDLVLAPDAGLYLVLRGHTSGATFSADATDAAGNLLYRWLLPTSGSTFISLSDTPGVYGSAGQLMRVNAAGNGLEFIDPSTVSGSVSWVNVTDKPATFPPTAHTHPVADISGFAEGVDDRVGALVKAGANIVVAYDDAAGTLTISASGTIEGTVSWVNISDKPASFPPDTHTHVIGDLTNFAESVDDRVAALLVPGANITLTYDDVANTLTVAASSPTATLSEKAASYTFALADANNFIDYNAAGAGAFTIPDDATTNFPVGTVISGGQIGAGALTIAAAAGVSLSGVAGGKATLTDSRSEYSIRKRAANSWRLSGDHGGVA